MKGSVAQVGRPCRVRVSITFFPPFARLFVIGSRHTIVRNGELSGRIIERACFPCYRFLLSLSLSSKTPSFSVRCRRTRVNKPRVRDKGNIYIYTRGTELEAEGQCLLCIVPCIAASLFLPLSSSRLTIPVDATHRGTFVWPRDGLLVSRYSLFRAIAQFNRNRDFSRE